MRDPVERLFAAFAEAGHELYLVGGAVRDRLLGADPDTIDDLDFATDARPEQTVAVLHEAGFVSHDVGSHFGSIGTILRYDGPGYPKDCQITTYRSSERYDHVGRHPDVTFGDHIDDDLWRRDLSINSIAMTATGALHDPFGGADDLRAGRLRAIGVAADRLREDPLRALRVARFQGQLGFVPTPELRDAVRAQAADIQRISRERWLIEMDKLLVSPFATDALEFLLWSGLLAEVLPELLALVGLHERPVDGVSVHHKDLWAHTLQVVNQTPATTTLRWTALLHDAGKADARAVDEAGRVSFHGHEDVSAALFRGVAERFKMDRERTRAIETNIALHGLVPSYSEEWTDSAVRRLARRAGPQLDELIAFARADLTTRFEEKRRAANARVDDLERRIRVMEAERALRPILPKGLGHALMKGLGLRPGPAIGELVRRIEGACLDGALPAEPSLEECLAFAATAPT